ncbi:hypothetical protein AKO1_014393 [Acrasis kona]|uniref:Conserved oligomeric Golgi complex subunit 4 n=1 Tax=Acrasis kona TaxID=1008807 RepID=A0AAW2YZU0_9EUKA
MNRTYLADDLFRLIDECKLREVETNKEFDRIIQNNAENIRNGLDNMEEIKYQVLSTQQRAQTLSSCINNTYELADSVSSKVRQLHRVQSRVQEAIDTVEGTIGMKSCLEGVESAIKSSDYELATEYVSKVLNLKPQTEGLSSDDEQKSSVIKSASQKLRMEVIQNFEANLQTPEIERFAKLMIPLRIEAEGLAIYEKQRIIATQDELDQLINNNIHQINGGKEEVGITHDSLLTEALDIIASTVEDATPFMQQYFGPHGQSIANIYKSSEEFIVRILDNFIKTKKLEDILEDIKRKLRANLIPDLDVKDLDLILSEISTLSARIEIVEKFIKSKCDLKDSNVSRKMQDLINYYIVLDDFYVKQSINIAIQMNMEETKPINGYHSEDDDHEEDHQEAQDSEEDEEDIDDSQKCSLLVEDAFYIFKKSATRSVESMNENLICAICNNLVNVILGPYKDELTKSVASIATYQNSFQFKNILTALNNIELSSEYVIKLRTSLEASIEEVLNINLVSSSGSHNKSAPHKLKAITSELVQTSVQLKELLRGGIKKLVSNTLEKELTNSIERITHYNYDISEADYARLRGTEGFAHTFCDKLESKLTEYERYLTTSNLDELIQDVVNLVTSQIESSIFKKRFNKLGGLQFEKDIRTLMVYFTKKTQRTRDKFARLTRMALLLKIQNAQDVPDFWDPNTWRMTSDDVRNVLMLRTEFKADVIKSLRLH